MDQDEARQRVEELRQKIRHHDYLYYVKNQPEISDSAYDELFQELKELEQQFPEYWDSNSPTQRVGAEPLDELPTVEHVVPLLSLDSGHTEDSLREFDRRVRDRLADTKSPTYVLEPKFDGASVELVYDAGELARASTRGDGRRGEGVIENIRTVGSVPLQLRTRKRSAPANLAVRGEVLMPIHKFEKLNTQLIERGEHPFANPRNAAAGSLRQLDPKITAARPLTMFAYEILQVEGAQFERHGDVLDALTEWGFQVSEDLQRAEAVEEIVEYHRQLAERRDDLEYEIDGVVVKLEDLSARRQLGATSHHPRWAFAFKFAPRREITQVMSIVPSVGRTGVVTPIALLRPVEIGGVTVSRASLHNREQLREMDIRPGDKVRVQRAGDVIPEIVERIESEDEREPPYGLPERCPSCDTPLTERGPFTICPNSFACPAQLAGRLEHLGSRGALDIEGLGEETARLLVETGTVESTPELFDLRAEDLIELEGFGQKKADNLVENIRNSAHVALDRFLYGLGIPEVGQTVARDLASHFQTLDRLLDAEQSELEEVDGVGPIMAESIVGFLSGEETRHLIDELVTSGRVKVEAHEAAGGPLEGLTFVFTGSLERWTRREAQDLIERSGARATSSVSGETDFVVVGENPGSKYEEAQEREVTTLDEARFIKLLNERGLEIP